MKRDHERSVTVTVRTEGGHSLTCSALMERDPNYLHWNRMSLLGDEKAMLSAMRLSGKGLVQWRLLSRNVPGLEAYTNDEFGSAIMRTVGRASGVNISHDSIQKIAAMELIELNEQVENREFDFPLGVTYGFLQRPSDWHVYSRAWSKRSNLTQRGPWRKVRDAGLRFRLLQVGEIQSDLRRSVEHEFIQIPGVEIPPVKTWEDPDQFFEAASELWFSLRIGITFWHRQLTCTLHERRTSKNSLCNIWHSEALEPRRTRARRERSQVLGECDKFLQSLSVTCHGLTDWKEQLHAAAFGYASSFENLTSEAALTRCVEGIECLLVAFEERHGFERKLVSSGRWRKTAGQLKKVIAEEGWEEEISSLAKRFVSSVPTMSLETRIQRMAQHFASRRKRQIPDLFDGIDRMINERNKIVHGRKIQDFQLLYVETMRARSIFEQLFLDFLGARRDVRLSSEARMAILQHSASEKA